MFYYDAGMDDPSLDLDRAVKTLLEARRGEWPRIAQRADVSYSWLSKFVNGHIDNPGFATLKKLHAVLTSPDSAQPTPEAA